MPGLADIHLMDRTPEMPGWDQERPDMQGQKLITAVLFALFSMVVVGPLGVAMAACHSHPFLPCGHAAFTGSADRSGAASHRVQVRVRAHVRGPRGLPGAKGQAGATGLRGSSGRFWPPGTQGSRGAGGATGSTRRTSPLGQRRRTTRTARSQG